MPEPAIKSEELLKRICELRFGDSSATKCTQLCQEMQIFLKTIRNTSNFSMSRQAINNWFYNNTKYIKRGRSRTFLYNFIKEKIVETPINSMSYRDTLNVLKSDQAVINTSYPGAKESLLLHLINASSRQKRSETADLFSTSATSVGDAEDQSYYALYRYSTTGGSIVKSFVVCKKPQMRESSLYTFVQFIHGGEEYQPDIFRESYGVMLKLDKSYYFLGSNYWVPLDKERSSTDDYEDARMNARSQPVGIELIVAEHDEIRLERGLFPGLITSVAAMMQPILGRVAFLHLGTARSLNYILTDDVVRPTEMARLQLADDLRNMVSRICRTGNERLGRVLENLIRKPTWAEIESSQLCDRLLKMLNNHPAWSDANVIADGALESYSSLGNRPRP